VKYRNAGACLLISSILLAAILFTLHAAPQTDSFRFVLLGDRTGEAQPGVWEQVWRETAAQKPAFVLTVGDTIQGTDDATAEEQWKEVDGTLRPYRGIPLYLVPGNHDVWSPASEKLYVKHSGHPLHYSFDHRNAHFTILDNSRSDALPAEEMDFLEKDLSGHADAAVKFVVFHRPSWIVNVALGNPEFPLQKFAMKFGVHYMIVGHVHQLIHADLDGVTYLSMPSAGGHLRLSGRYQDGWFFGYAVVEVREHDAVFEIHELKPPHGEGRTTSLADWGKVGLIPK
jgi:hypothetical protein